MNRAPGRGGIIKELKNARVRQQVVELIRALEPLKMIQEYVTAISALGRTGLNREAIDLFERMW